MPVFAGGGPISILWRRTECGKSYVGMIRMSLPVGPKPIRTAGQVALYPHGPFRWVRQTLEAPPVIQLIVQDFLERE